MVLVTDLEKKAKRAAYMRKYYQLNKEKTLDAQRANYPKTKAAVIARGRIKLDRHQELLTAIKLEQGCVDCGRKDGMLHFDHVDPGDKAFNLSAAHTRSALAIQAEIAKCVVRCERHHAKRHTEARWAAQHAAGLKGRIRPDMEVQL